MLPRRVIDLLYDFPFRKSKLIESSGYSNFSNLFRSQMGDLFVIIDFNGNDAVNYRINDFCFMFI